MLAQDVNCLTDEAEDRNAGIDVLRQSARLRYDIVIAAIVIVT